MLETPNVIVLLLDAARQDRFSCYGYNRNTTPNIDNLAEGGTIYQNAYSQSIWSLPAYSSIFTGEYPSVHGAVDWDCQVTQNPLIESLNDANYTTLCSAPHLLSGDFGLAGAFQKHRWISVDKGGSMWEMDPVVEKLRIEGQKGNLDSRSQLARLVVYYMLKERSLQTVPNGLRWLNSKLRDRFGYWGDDGGRKTIETAKELITDAEEPYFLFCNFTEPHYEYRPPRNHIYDFIDDDRSIKEINEALGMNEIQATAGAQQISDTQKDLLISLADACLRYTDELIGELLEVVDLSNTVVVALSDHGDLHGEWGIWGHQRRIHQYLCNVPLIIHYPWDAPEKETSPVELRSLYSLIKNIGDGTRGILETKKYVISEYHGWDTQLFIDPWEDYEEVKKEESTSYQVSCATEDWHLLIDSTSKVELYDKEADPGQQNNVAENYPAVVQELKDKIHASVGTPQENDKLYRNQMQRRSQQIGDEVRDRLDDLGYV